MSQSRRLGYESEKAIMQHLPFQLRYQLSQKSPSLATAHKVIPIIITKISMISVNALYGEFCINNAKAKITREEGTNNVFLSYKSNRLSEDRSPVYSKLHKIHGATTIEEGLLKTAEPFLNGRPGMEINGQFTTNIPIDVQKWMPSPMKIKRVCMAGDLATIKSFMNLNQAPEYHLIIRYSNNDEMEKVTEYVVNMFSEYSRRMMIYDHGHPVSQRVSALLPNANVQYTLHHHNVEYDDVDWDCMKSFLSLYTTDMAVCVVIREEQEQEQEQEQE